MVLSEQTPVKIVITVLILLVAISLLVKGKRKGIKGVSILGLCFIALAGIMFNRISTDFFPDAITSGKTYFYMIVAFYYVIYALFTHFTFYGGKNSPIKLIILFNIIAAITMFFLTISAELTGQWANADTPVQELHINFLIAYYINIGMNLITTSWRFNTSRISYAEIKENDTVEDWIKLRYKFVMISSILWIIVGMILPILLTINPFSSLLFFAYIGLEIVSWGAPKKIKAWANRNFTSEDQSTSMSEEEILKQMGEN